MVMKKIFNIYVLIFKYLAVFFILAKFSVSYGDQITIEKIKINGERRLSESFILNFFPDYPNTKFSDEIINNFTKDLYNTGMFSKINININNSTLEVNVVEFPIINEISFVGNDLLESETLSDIVTINSRDVLNEDNLNDSIEKIKIEYQKLGRYLAEVNVSKSVIGEGRVNLNFDIKEGALLVVKNINFEGNNNFSDNELKSYISTKEDAWYKIFGSNKFIPERLEYDKEKLKDFYKQRGFVDFNVLVARGDLLPNFSGFNLNFIINEGQRYTVNKINISTKLIDEKKIQYLLNELYLKKDDFF